MTGVGRALALWAGMAGMAGMAGAETVRIGTEPAFPPFVWQDENGALTGFDKAVGDEICARAALTCDWVITSFDDLLTGVAEGRFDLAMAGLGNATTRREIVDFSEIYLPSVNPAAFVGRPGAPIPREARIGVQRGTIHEDHMAAQGLPYAVFDSAEAALAAASAGQIDLVFGASSYFSVVLPDSYPTLQILGLEDVGVDGTAIAITKGRDDLRMTLNTTISGMRDDGTLEAMIADWFSPRRDL